MTEGEIDDHWPLEPGASIEDRFTLLQQLRKGSHGAVYVAESKFSGKRIALKVLFNSAKDYAERMRAEARALGAINHPNVVPIDDGGVTTSLSPVSGLLWFAMPLQDGPTLRDEIDRVGALPIERAARFLEQIASGCEAAHGVGIIHRDLKPENIIVVSATDSIVILDFGVSKLSERLRTGSGLKTTDRHRILGTSEYNAPERILEGATDARSDIYSAGVVANEMLVGRHYLSIGPGPRDFPNSVALGTMLLFEHPKPVQELRPDIPEQLAALVNQMLEKDPERRPQSMREVAARAREHLASTSLAIGARDIPSKIAARTASNAPVIRARPEPPAPLAPVAATRSFRSSGPVEIRSSEASLTIDAALVCGAARFAARTNELTDVERGMRVLAAQELRDRRFHGLLASYAANTCHATAALRARVRKAFALVGTGTHDEASGQLERLRADASRGGWTPESSQNDRKSQDELICGAGLLIPPDVCSEAAENALARMDDLDEATRGFAHSILLAFARVPLEHHADARGPLVALALGTAEDSELARAGLARFLLSAAQVRDQEVEESDDTQPELEAPVDDRLANAAQSESVSTSERSAAVRTAITPTPSSMTTPAKPSPASAEIELPAPRVNALLAFAVTVCVALVILAAALLIRRAGAPVVTESKPEHGVAAESAASLPGMGVASAAGEGPSAVAVESARELPVPNVAAPTSSGELPARSPQASGRASSSQNADQHLAPIYGAAPRPSIKPVGPKSQPLPGSGL